MLNSHEALLTKCSLSGCTGAGQEGAQSQDEESRRLGTAAPKKGRGRPKGLAAVAAPQPDKPQESGVAAAARLFGGGPKRKPNNFGEQDTTAR